MVQIPGCQISRRLGVVSDTIKSMKWETFVEKAYNDWSYEMINNRISMLENLRTPEEIAELVEYALDEKGIVKLLKRAMADDVHFTSEQVLDMAACMSEAHADVIIQYSLNQGLLFRPEDAVEMYGNCSDEVLNRVVQAVSAPFTKEQVEELDGNIDEAILSDLYAGVGVAMPSEDEDEEEFLVPNESVKSVLHTEKLTGINEEAAHYQYSTPQSARKAGILHSIRKALFPKKYTYVFVLFEGAKHAYSYLTTDKTIKNGDIVIVPVGANNEPKPAYVEEVRTVTEDNIPYPLEKTKSVIRRAKKKEIKEFLRDDLRIPMDISYYRVKTKTGIKEVTTSEAERVPLREKYKNHPVIKTVETRKPAKPKDDLAWIDELEFFDAIFDDK